MIKIEALLVRQPWSGGEDWRRNTWTLACEKHYDEGVYRGP